MKRHISYLLLIAILVVVGGWGWNNYLGAIMVTRGNVREACYLASEFADFCRKNDRPPNGEEAASFSTRLTFVEIRNDQYVYKCGLYARDALIIQRGANNRLQFYVVGNEFK